MAAAFRSLRTEMFNGRRGDRPNARNIAYFLTDGTNDVQSDMAESEAELTVSSGVRLDSSQHIPDHKEPLYFKHELREQLCLYIYSCLSMLTFTTTSSRCISFLVSTDQLQSV